MRKTLHPVIETKGGQDSLVGLRSLLTMKIIIPENEYSSNIEGKIRPIINEGYLSDPLCEWISQLFTDEYNEDLDAAIIAAKYVRTISESKNLLEDYLLFILFCTAKAFIEDKNCPFPVNTNVADNILEKLISDYDSDFTDFFIRLLKQKGKDFDSLSVRTIKDKSLAQFLIQQKLLNYKSFIDFTNISKAFYSLYSEGDEWYENNYALSKNLDKIIQSWGYWLPILKNTLKQTDFDYIFNKVDSEFYSKYFLTEPTITRFNLAENYIQNLLELSGYHPNRHIKFDPLNWLFDKAKPYFHHLLDLYNKQLHNDECLRIILRLAHISYRSDISVLPDSIRTELLFLSQKAVGNFRSSLKAVELKKDLNSKKLALVNEAINFIAYFDSPTKAFIQVIQLLRNLRTCSVNNDLSYKVPRPSDHPYVTYISMHGLPDEDPPMNIDWFPAKLEWLIVCFMEIHKVDLIPMREELSKFVGSRLKTKKGTGKETPGNNDFIEPNPLWRQCYLSSIRALHCNPGGKLHHILNFSRNSDPDEDVRIEAKKAYKEIRQDNPLPSEMKQVLTIRRAFWFLRQSHFVSLLGIDELDIRGSQRTYSKEVEQCKARILKQS